MYINGAVTTYIWNENAEIVAEVDNISQSIGNTYVYGLDRILNKNGFTYYQHNSHGDVIGITDLAKNWLVHYGYDAFGEEILGYIDNTGNNFKYCGEYFDAESGSYYLRARYYQPSVGRFTTEDPIRAGSNWYVYCNNNPVMFIDRFGLDPVAIRDYTNRYGGTVNWDDTLGVASFKINDNTLWITGSGENDEGIAVTNVDGRLYAEESDLNNFFFGVTPDDTKAGVRITMFNGTPYIDISAPVANALKRDVGNFETNKGKNGYFISRVGDKGDWNLKYREADENHWEETLGISFWGYQTQMLLNGKLVIVEQVGNITYGYLGAAAGMSESWMNFGSAVNHFFKHGFFGWENERADQSLFKLGINWYNTGVMQ